MDVEHELWSFNNALFVVVLIIILVLITIFGANKIFDVRAIKNNWAQERCNPMIMPFASIFGYNTKDNFEFCLGKIFNTHSMPFFSSIGGMFSQFTNLLTEIFNSISSLRNVIASLGGGINVVFQEFTERISMFFFKLRISAIHIKTLMGRLYAILFSVMYMGMSGITGMTSFTNTFLFSFLNTFCFPKNTILHVKNKGLIEIKDIKIGDILLPSNSRVTATFQFYSKGQPMVRIGSTVVSTNHYVLLNGKPIKSDMHPDALNMGLWNSNEPLYCLNTSDNHIPINDLLFLDYDETTDGDIDTMRYIESRINAIKIPTIEYKFKEYCPAIGEFTIVKTTHGNKYAKNINIGDILVSGGEVIGLVKREVSEICRLYDGTIITPSTLYWNKYTQIWERIGMSTKVINTDSEFIEKLETPLELISFIVIPNSQIELENGLRIRDYMELCSPDSEIYYSKCLENIK